MEVSWHAIGNCINFVARLIDACFFITETTLLTNIYSRDGGQTCPVYEPHIVKPKLQRAAKKKSRNNYAKVSRLHDWEKQVIDLQIFNKNLISRKFTYRCAYPKLPDISKACGQARHKQVQYRPFLKNIKNIMAKTTFFTYVNLYIYLCATDSWHAS